MSSEPPDAPPADTDRLRILNWAAWSYVELKDSDQFDGGMLPHLTQTWLKQSTVHYRVDLAEAISNYETLGTN